MCVEGECVVVVVPYQSRYLGRMTDSWLGNTSGAPGPLVSRAGPGGGTVGKVIS